MSAAFNHLWKQQYLFLYKQVKFHGLRTVVRVATRGGVGDWVTLYRLAYSEDCITFHNLLDGAWAIEVIIIIDSCY